jgi:hypothetical protein
LTNVASTEVAAVKETLPQEGLKRPASEAKEMLTEPLLLICTEEGTARVTARVAGLVAVESASAPFTWTLAVDKKAGIVVPVGKFRMMTETPGRNRPSAPTAKVTL